MPNVTSKKKAKKSSGGRPPKGGRQYNVKLTDDTAEALRLFGDGNLTLGIERAAKMLPKSQ